MEKELKRYHKLALPLIVERSGSSLTISDGMFEKHFDFKDFGKLRVTSIDSDGFVTFEISGGKQQTLVEPSASRGTKNIEVGFVFLGSGTAKSSSGTASRATYEYYKRVADEYYYAAIKLGSKVKKIHLGSLQDASSHLRLIIRAIQTFGDEAIFDRKALMGRLSYSALRHGQKLKSALDILVMEGYLEKRESQRRGKPYEQFKKTLKILSIKS
jgi:hypothetical protein